jgi:hypothetical protein
MLTSTQKDQIKSLLRSYVDRMGSQNKAANSLKGVSSATISLIINDNWESISEDMWLNVGKQIGWSAQQWVAVETRDYLLINRLLDDARLNSNCLAITGDSGSGKSFTLKNYAENNKRVYLLECAGFWNKKIFLQELLSSIGRDSTGLNVAEMMAEIVRALKIQDKPLIVLDEADKLNDQVLYFFITLYNCLEDHAGIVIIATDHLEKRIRKGLRLNRQGYKEIYSRVARKFIELHGVGSVDITKICQANGIEDRSIIKNIIEDSEYDLRRVRRKIHALKSSI